MNHNYSVISGWGIAGEDEEDSLSLCAYIKDSTYEAAIMFEPSSDGLKTLYSAAYREPYH